MRIVQAYLGEGMAPALAHGAALEDVVLAFKCERTGDVMPASEVHCSPTVQRY